MLCYSIITSPAEVFAAPNDYHLHPKSPALDAGLTLPGVEADLEGRPRPQGVAYDIGAFEYPAALPNKIFAPAILSTD